MNTILSLAPFQTSKPHFVPAGAIITATPDAGATAKVEYTKGSAADIANGVATWAPWAKGTVSSAASDVVDQAAYIRVTAMGGNVAVRLNSNPTAAELGALSSTDWGPALQLAVDSAGIPAGVAAQDGKTYALSAGASSVGLRKAQAVPLLQYVNQANFAVSGAGAAKADSYTPILSPQAVTLTGTTAAGSANLDRAGLNLDISNLDDFLLNWYTQTPTLVNGVSLFMCSDASGFTNYAKVDLLTASVLGQRDMGVNVLGWRKSEMTVVGSPDLTSIKQVRTQVYSATGGAMVTFDSIWANAKTRAKAMVIFDDGWSEAYDFNGGHGMYTAMKARGLKGSLSVIGGLVGSAGYVTHAQLREMNDAGFDLSVHGINYGGTVNNYQNLTQFPAEADAITNIAQNRNFLLSMGLNRAADFYCFPQGKYTETMLPSMRTLGIGMARGTYEAVAFPYFPIPDYIMKLPAVDHGGKTFAQIKPFIDRAILTGGTIIIYGHRIQTAAGGTGLFVTQAEFEQTLDYLVANKASIDTVTQSDWKAQVLASRTV